MDKAGVNPDEVRTWDDFYEAAKKVRATGSYITSDSGDAGFFDSMTWLAGATPFETGEDGTSVKINLTGDDKVQSFIDFWQKLIDEDLIDTKTAGMDRRVEPWPERRLHRLPAHRRLDAVQPALRVPRTATASGASPRCRPSDGSETNSENGGSSLAIIKTDDEAKAEGRVQVR